MAPAHLKRFAGSRRHVEGSREEQLRQDRTIRDLVKRRILNPGGIDFPFPAMLGEKTLPID